LALTKLSYPTVRRFIQTVIPLILLPAAAASEIAPPQFNSEQRAAEMQALVIETPESLGALKHRAGLVWSWVNEIAMTPRRIPAEVSSLLARILTLSDNESSPARLALLNDSLKAYVLELSVLEGRPQLLGVLSTSTPGPFNAGSRQHLNQIYTIGAEPMLPGSGLLITQHWSYGAPFQTSDSSKSNYVTVTSSRADVRFRSKGLLRGGIHGGLTRALPVLYFEIEEGILSPGDLIQINYGPDTGLQLPDGSTDGFALPVYVRLAKDQPFLSLPIQPFQIIGDAIASVSGVAPSIVTARVPFDLQLTCIDKFGNKASGRIPSLEIIVNGEFHSRTESGYQALITVPGIVFQQTGVQEITLKSSGGGISGKVNPVKVVSIPSQQILWGDLRGITTDISSGLGSIEYQVSIARDERQLDFAALADHDMWIDDWEWERIKFSATHDSDRGEFKVFPGYQRSMPLVKGGNQSVIFQDSEHALRISQHVEGRLTSFYQRLRQLGDPNQILIISNTDQPGDWRYADPDLMSLVEIKSDRGFFEWYGRKFADRGYRTGFTASQGATVSTDPTLYSGGLTAVVSDNIGNPSEGIFRSLKSARTYATSGQRMILGFAVNGGKIGDRIPYADTRYVSGEVIGTSPLDSIVVMKNGQAIWEKSFLQTEQETSSAESIWIKLDVYSDSVPLNEQIDLPRPGREWIGYVQINEGKIESFRAPGFEKVARKRALIHPENSRRVDFVTRTRGADSGFLVEISGVTEDLVFDINIKQGFENDAETPLSRPPSATPQVRQKVALNELSQGRVIRKLAVNGYMDRFEMEIVNPDSSRSHQFEFIDNVTVNHGDYYYLKVRQIDDVYGWTSPIWVGGFSRGHQPASTDKSVVNSIRCIPRLPDGIGPRSDARLLSAV
jgi:hypothetical protein